ncbi:STT3 domain-containing protein [Maridesulfovibrio sp.]|uniref:STT3 domain-containing protein n=1 Tax=Maridesulfovibrio sp. TaxID=2795000 RepID=UPI002A18DC1C|nr:STT3 domain-containing protein [Maridesulfovibrio sp.]
MNIRGEFRMPAWAAGWKVFLVFAFVSFAFAFGLRCLDLPKWTDPSFKVNGEFIMGTHDAYYWLAGAKGVGSAVKNPMAHLVRFLGSITGAQYGNIAFWLPAVFAGFTAVAAFAWGALVGGSWVGLACAAFATSIPAYYYRTRLSYYDTDVVTLFFPLLISVLIARWLKPGLKEKWFGDSGDHNKYEPTGWDYLLMVLAGALTSYGELWHSDLLTFGVVAGVIAVGLVFMNGIKENRPVLLRGIILFAAPAFLGLPGFALSLVLLCVFLLFPGKAKQFLGNIWVCLALLVLIIVVGGIGQRFVQILIVKFHAYLKPVADTAVEASGPKYPGIAQSVIEAQNLSFEQLFYNLTGSAWLGWLAFAGFAFTLIVSPLVSLLLPFAGVTFAAITMGGRFSMFGGIAIGLGLSYTAEWMIRRYMASEKEKRIMSAVQSMVVISLLFLNFSGIYQNAPATPIMGANHVIALVESGKKMPKNSTIWTWWDWGYASMYYTGVNSFANGGHHGGPVLFPLAFIYSTPSLLQSNQMVKFAAANNNNPAVAFDKMTPGQAQYMLGVMGKQQFKFPPIHDQYVVVSWENIRLAYWILFYGSWNLETGNGIHPYVRALMSAFDVDFGQGMLTVKGQGTQPLSSYDILKPEGEVRKDFSANSGPHLLYNTSVRQGFLVDDFAYASMLIKLLVLPAKDSEVGKYFELVYDGFPNVRVYRVL